MKQRKRLNLQRRLRAKRTRAGIFGTSKKPRLSVFRSNKFTYAQLIDDENHKTLATASTEKSVESGGEKLSKTARAEKLGKVLAEKAKKSGIVTAVFDKGLYKYHGRVKAVAEGARQGGLKF